MGSSRLATYAADEVTITIIHKKLGLSHTLSGFSTDSKVTIERATDTWEHQTGVDDTTTRVYSANRSSKITLHLSQGSSSNDVLTALHEYDVRRKDSSGIFAIQVKDNSGRTTFFSPEAYIGVPPTATFNQSLTNRDWVIQCTRGSTYLGGNGPVDAEDVAVMQTLGFAVDPKWI